MCVRVCVCVRARADIIHLLLASGARVKEKNMCGWTPIDEAISLGNRNISEYRGVGLTAPLKLPH